MYVLMKIQLKTSYENRKHNLFMNCACLCGSVWKVLFQSTVWCSYWDLIIFEHVLFYTVANSRAEVKGILHRHDGEAADVQKGTRRST
jgi:hypothetical protein